MVCKTHMDDFKEFVKRLENIGYSLTYSILNASDYNVPQDRKRVFLIGLRTDLNLTYVFPEKERRKVTLRDAIGDLPEAVASEDNKVTSPDNLNFPNHEYMTGSFSSIYMSRNRVRKWDEQSFTI